MNYAIKNFQYNYRNGKIFNEMEKIENWGKRDFKSPLSLTLQKFN